MRNYIFTILKDKECLLEIAASVDYERLYNLGDPDSTKVVVTSYTKRPTDLYYIYEDFSTFTKDVSWNHTRLVNDVKRFIDKDVFEDIEQKMTFVCTSKYYDKIELLIHNLFTTLLNDGGMISNQISFTISSMR